MLPWLPSAQCLACSGHVMQSVLTNYIMFSTEEPVFKCSRVHVHVHAHSHTHGPLVDEKRLDTDVLKICSLPLQLTFCN